MRGAVLEDVWSAPFERALPVQRFAARKGQQHLSRLYGQRRRAGMWGLSHGGTAPAGGRCSVGAMVSGIS